MGSITSLKCVLTQEHLDAICAKYFVPEEVHPQLPSSDATMHERPAGKVGMYTRFFDYANYRIPFSTFFVSVLTHFRIPFSQLSVFGSAKNWNDHFFWVDEFVVPANAQFEMDLNVFIRTADPRKVRIVERARAENERPIVTMAKHRTVTLLPTSVDNAENQSCPARIMLNRNTGTNRTKEKRGLGGGGGTRGSERTPAASHPPKRLRDDYGTTGGSATRGKSPSVLNSVTLEESGDHNDSVTGPYLRNVDLSIGMTSAYHCNGFFSSVADTAPTDLLIAGKNRICPTSIQNLINPNSGHCEQVSRLFSQVLASSDRSGRAANIRLIILSSEVRMRAEYNILEKRRWKSLAEEKDNLLQVKDKEIEELRSQLLQAKDESMEVARLRTRVSSLEAIEASSSSLRSQNQSLVNQVNELETSSTDLRGKLEMYEGSMKQLEEFQDNLMKPLEARLAEIDADFTRWLLTHGMKLLMAKCLNSTEYMEALGNAFGRAIEKGMQEGLAAGIEHGQAGRCLSDLEAYNPSAEADFNSVVRDLRGLDFPLLRELFAKKDASTWDVMDLLRLDDAVAEVLGMTDLQPDVGQLMVPVHHKQDKVVIGSQALSVALETCHRRVRKMERNLAERLPLLRDVFVSIDHPVSTEALAILPETSTEPLVTALVTTALSTMVIHPNPDPFLLVEDYENLDLTGMVLADVIPGSKGSSCSESGHSILRRDAASVPYVKDFLSMWLKLSTAPLFEVGLSQVPSGKEIPSSSTTTSTSLSFMDFSFNSSTNTCLLRCAKLVDAILLSASAFLFLLLGTCFIELRPEGTGSDNLPFSEVLDHVCLLCDVRSHLLGLLPVLKSTLYLEVWTLFLALRNSAITMLHILLSLLVASN
ncbi:hypothetical protein Tco_0970691 [Tanacetum coccineum]